MKHCQLTPLLVSRVTGVWVTGVTEPEESLLPTAVPGATVRVFTQAWLRARSRCARVCVRVALSSRQPRGADFDTVVTWTLGHSGSSLRRATERGAGRAGTRLGSCC